MNTIKQTIKSVLEIEKLPPELQEEMILRVGAVIYQNVLIRASELIRNEDQEELEKMFDKNSTTEEVFSFLKDKVPGFEKIIEEEALKFKDKANTIMSKMGK